MPGSDLAVSPGMTEENAVLTMRGAIKRQEYTP
jgi:hypothetical protein